MPTYGKTYAFLSDGHTLNGEFRGWADKDKAIVSQGSRYLVVFDSALEYDRVPRLRASNGCTAVKPPEEIVDRIENGLNAKVTRLSTAHDVIGFFARRQHESFIVGGTVRDALGGTAAADVDLVTTMHPRSVARQIRAQLGKETSLHGERGSVFATLRRLWDKNPVAYVDPVMGLVKVGGTRCGGDSEVDVIGMRCDWDVCSVAPAFDNSIERDSRFRDFACNSVYYDPAEKLLYDPTGWGISDAENKLVRLIEPTALNLRENPRLILRAYKMLAKGYDIEQGTHQLVCANARETLEMPRGQKIRFLTAQIFEKNADDGLERFWRAIESDGHDEVLADLKGLNKTLAAWWQRVKSRFRA